MSECKCNLRTRLVGDGCEKCNPQMAIELLIERLAELRAAADQADEEYRAEIARLRLTDAERDDMACAASRLESDPNGPRDLQVAATLRGLLDRHGCLPDREHPPRKGHATPARSGKTGDDSPDRE